MPTKAKKSKTESKGKKSDEAVGKSLWDHVNHIRYDQDPNYYDKLTEGDKKSWSSFMILKALSMDKDFVDYSADLFKLIEVIPPRAMYKVLIGLVSKFRGKTLWIKGKPNPFPSGVVDFIAKHYEISRLQAQGYVKLYFMMDDGKKVIRDMMSQYGMDDKEIKKRFKGDDYE